jgi:hypothetical protein
MGVNRPTKTRVRKPRGSVVVVVTSGHVRVCHLPSCYARAQLCGLPCDLTWSDIDAHTVANYDRAGRDAGGIRGERVEVPMLL